MIEPLLNYHLIQNFRSNPVTDRWLKINAIKDQLTDRARTFVKLSDSKVVGFYSSQVFSEHRDINGILLIKLAVDIRHQQKGYGKELLQHAITGAKKIKEITGCQGIITYAKDSAVPFYRKFDFIMINETDNEMFLRL